MTHRNRALLDLCHEAPCFLQLGAVGCGNDKSVPCHSDMIRHGRGVGEKSHDCFAVPGCPACHELFKRSHLGKEGYYEKWAEAFERWMLYLWVSGKIQITTSPRTGKESEMKPPKCRLCQREHWLSVNCYGKPHDSNTPREGHGVLKAEGASPDATPSASTESANPPTPAKPSAKKKAKKKGKKK